MKLDSKKCTWLSQPAVLRVLALEPLITGYYRGFPSGPERTSITLTLHQRNNTLVGVSYITYPAYKQAFFFLCCDEYTDSFMSFTAAYSLPLSVSHRTEVNPAHSGQKKKKRCFRDVVLEPGHLTKSLPISEGLIVTVTKCKSKKNHFKNTKNSTTSVRSYFKGFVRLHLN